MTIDNNNAKWLANELAQIPGILCNPDNVETNMIGFGLDPALSKKRKGKDKLDPITLCGLLKEEHNILLMASFHNDGIRTVVHRDVNR